MIWLVRPLAELLVNRPMGRDQTIRQYPEAPGQYILTTNTDDRPQLRRWLTRRVGSELEILEPASLR